MRTPASTEQSRALVSAMVDAINDHAIDAMERFWASDMVWHGPAGAGVKETLRAFQDGWQRGYLNAFNDKRAYDRMRIVEGPLVMCTGFQEAHHSGEFLGQAATGKPTRLRYMDVWWCTADRIVENWVLLDFVDLLRQIGLDPLNGQGWDLEQCAIAGEVVKTPQWPAPVEGEPIGAGPARELGQVLVERYLDLLNGVAVPLAEVLHEDALWRGPAGIGVTSGSDRFVADWLSRLRAALPDASFSLEHTIIDGDRIGLHGRIEGTQSGPFFGLAPSANKVSMRWMEIWRIGADGRLHEAWALLDLIDGLRQSGRDPLNGQGWDARDAGFRVEPA